MRRRKSYFVDYLVKSNDFYTCFIWIITYFSIILIYKIVIQHLNLMKSKQSTPFFLTLLCILHQIATSFEFASLVITPSSLIINTPTVYQILYNRSKNDTIFSTTPYLTTTIQPTDTVTCTFPSNYVLSPTLNCNISINGSMPPLSRSCSASGSTVTVSGIVSVNTTIAYLTLWVWNITNPSPAMKISNFTGTIGNDTSGNDTSICSVELQSDNFQSCSITFSPNIVNTTNESMILTIVPKNQISIGGSLSISFSSSRWSTDISTTNYLPLNQNMNCSSRSSNVLSNIRCGSSSGTLVNVTNLFGVNVNSVFSFSIDNFLSPPTEQQSDPINITSLMSQGPLDSCIAYVTGLAPKAINDLSISTSDGSTITINKNYQLIVTFILTDTISSTDTLYLIFPSSSKLTIINVQSSFGMNGYSLTSNNLSVFLKNDNTIYSIGTLFTIGIDSYTAPATSQITQNFIISIYRNGYIKMQGTTTITPLPGNIKGTIQITNSQININTSYIFSISIQDPISSNGMIKIIIPLSVTILSPLPSCANIVGTNVTSLPTCSIDYTENSITLQNINKSASSINSQTMVITVYGLQNPSSTAQTNQFVINTYNTGQYSSLIATGKLPGITPSPTPINPNDITITYSSNIVNDIQVTYIFELTIRTQLPIDGHFQIYLPPQLSLNIASIPTQCNVSLNSSVITGVKCVGVNNGTGTMITFTNISYTDIPIDTVINVQLSNIINNPSSTKPTKSIGIYTYDDYGYLLTDIQNMLNVVMTIPDQFIDISFRRSSEKNYQVCNYTFYLLQKSEMSNNSILMVRFPSNVVPIGKLSCSMSLPINATLTCSIQNSSVNIIISSIIPSNNNFSITISGIRNPPSYAPTDSIIFTTRLPVPDSEYTYSQSPSSSGIINTIPSDFSSLTYTFTPLQFNTSTTLQIAFQPSFSPILPNTIQLTLAGSFILGNISCNSFINVDNGSCRMITSSYHLLQIQGNFSNGGMKVSVTGLTSPVKTPSDYSILASLDKEGYLIDLDKDTILFGLVCQISCKICDVTSTANCISCDDGYYLLDGSCVLECPSGYKLSGSTCIDIAVQSMTSPENFAVPFTIAACVVMIACLMSKLQFTSTFIPGAVFALIGLIQWGALIYFLYLYRISMYVVELIPFYIGIAAIGYLVFLNLFAVVLQNYLMYGDEYFIGWVKDNICKIVSYIVNVIGTIISHKFRNILFCKLFNFEIFTAQLQSVGKFKIMHIFSFLSLLHSATAIFASAVALRYVHHSSQLFYSCIDVIIVTLLNAIFAYFNVRKPDDFFPVKHHLQLKQKIYGELDFSSNKLEQSNNKQLTKLNRININNPDISHGSLMDRYDNDHQERQKLDENGQQLGINAKQSNIQFDLDIPDGDEQFGGGDGGGRRGGKKLGSGQTVNRNNQQSAIQGSKANTSKQPGKRMKRKIHKSKNMANSQQQNDQNQQGYYQQNDQDIKQAGSDELEETVNKKWIKQQSKESTQMTWVKGKSGILQPEELQVYKEYDVEGRDGSEGRKADKDKDKDKQKGQIQGGSQLDKDSNEDSVGIHIKPFGPNFQNLHSDQSDALDYQLHHHNQIHRKIRQKGEYSQQQDFKKLQKRDNIYDNSFDRSTVPVKSRLSLENINKDGKGREWSNSKRFLYQHQEKQSGEDSLQFATNNHNNNKKFLLSTPFETDKQQTEFRILKDQSENPQRMVFHREVSTVPDELSTNNKTEQRQPFSKKKHSTQNKLFSTKMKSYNQSSQEQEHHVYPQILQGYMPESDNVRESQSKEGQLPDDLKEYYLKGAKSAREKSKQGSYRNSLADAERIYMRRPETGKR